MRRLCSVEPLFFHIPKAVRILATSDLDACQDAEARLDLAITKLDRLIQNAFQDFEARLDSASTKLERIDQNEFQNFEARLDYAITKLDRVGQNAFQDSEAANTLQK